MHRMPASNGQTNTVEWQMCITYLHPRPRNFCKPFLRLNRVAELDSSTPAHRTSRHHSVSSMGTKYLGRYLHSKLYAFTPAKAAAAAAAQPQPHARAPTSCPPANALA